METAIAMKEMGLTLANEGPLESVLAFVASRSKKSTHELPAAAGEMFRGFAAFVDQTCTSAIEKRTAAEFRELFAQAFPKYFVMMLALSRVAQVTVPGDVLERLTRESICELEADFRDKALAIFGADIRDQALFTVWTLRKINDVLARISEVPLDKANLKEDKEYCEHFNINVLQANFSLDCFSMALRLNRPIYPEVMAELKDGLRAMVNAYAWARRRVDARIPGAEPSWEPRPMDEENEQLLKASMQDMASMLDDESPSNNV